MTVRCRRLSFVYVNSYHILTCDHQFNFGILFSCDVLHADANMMGCSAMKILELDTTMFANGDEYFEKGGRLFPRNDSGCTENGSSRCTMVVHNNVIVTLRAKIYRFKEHGM